MNPSSVLRARLFCPLCGGPARWEQWLVNNRKTLEARRVIRAATRSAYAEVCGLPELGEANYKTMLAQEQSKDWSREQILMIEALHLFAVSYFTGNAKITETSEEAPAAGDAGDGTTTISKGGEGGETQEVEAPPAPKCPPEQKQKVQNAIQAYVQAAQTN
jgi:hypothetical protein